MFKTMFQVPETDNGGNRVLPEVFDAIETRLVETFGAFSRRDGMQGAWQGPDGRVYRDRNTTYEVALNRWKQIAEWLAIVEDARQVTRQLALYIEIAGVPDIWDGP